MRDRGRLALYGSIQQPAYLYEPTDGVGVGLDEVVVEVVAAMVAVLAVVVVFVELVDVVWVAEDEATVDDVLDDEVVDGGVTNLAPHTTLLKCTGKSTFLG